MQPGGPQLQALSEEETQGRATRRLRRVLLSGESQDWGPGLQPRRGCRLVPSGRAPVPRLAPSCRLMPSHATGQVPASVGPLRPSSCRPSGAWGSSNLGVGGSNPSRRASCFKHLRTPSRTGKAALTATETRPLRQVIRHQQVGGSSPPGGSNSFGALRPTVVADFDWR